MAVVNKKYRNIGISTTLVLLGVGAYSLYKSLSKKPITAKKLVSKSTTIVLSDSILSSKLPLSDILNQTKNTVLLLPPGISFSDLDLNSDISYKVIECDTYPGVWSVVKHLNSEIVFVVEDENEIPEDVERMFRTFLKFAKCLSYLLTDTYLEYVGDLIKLEQNADSINQTVLSYIIY